MKTYAVFVLAAAVVIGMLPKTGEAAGPNAVRVEQLVIKPEYLEAFKAALDEEMRETLQREPGVLALYAVTDRENPARCTVFGVYADDAAYSAHRATPHFQKFFETTKPMIAQSVLLKGVPVTVPDSRNIPLETSAPLPSSFPRDEPFSVMPVPPAEKNLPRVDASLHYAVNEPNHMLDGAIFDKDGNFLFCDATAGRVLRLAPDKTLSTVLEFKDFSPVGLALHKDGRLFVTALNREKGLGKIVSLAPGTTRMETILPPEAGFLPKDIVFDANGGLYFTDFRGTATRLDGGVYYLEAGTHQILPVLPDMGQASGVTISPDGKTLWATEYARNLLHRVTLKDGAVAAPAGANIAYHFIGPAPAGLRVDAGGNVYVALTGQGRALVFNAYGLPVGQVLVPGRDKGNNLRSTSLALHPKRAELCIVTGNNPGAPSSEANVFVAPALAQGSLLSD